MSESEFMLDPDQEEITQNLSTDQNKAITEPEKIDMKDLRAQLLAELKAELKEELKQEMLDQEKLRQQIDESEKIENPILHKRYKITFDAIPIGGTEQGQAQTMLSGVVTKADLILAGCDFDWLIRAGALEEL